MFVAGVRRHPGVVHLPAEVAGKGHRRTRKIQRTPPAAGRENHLHLVRIGEILRSLKGRRQRRHRRRPSDKFCKPADLLARHQRLVGLHVNHPLRPHRAVCLGETVRAALVRDRGHDGLKACRVQRRRQQGIVHREPKRELRSLHPYTLRHPEHQRFAFDVVQELARETRGFESAGHDDCGSGGHDTRTLPALILGCKTGLGSPHSRHMDDTASAATSSQLSRELVVQNKMGIHARPAAMIVRITNKFKSDVMVEKDDEQVNGKSIMGLMMLAAGKGSKVKFLATGADSIAVLDELEALFSRKFDEA